MSKKHGPYDLPESLFQFAMVPDFDAKVQQLSELAEREEWSYIKMESETPLPILNNYVRYTFKRIAEEKKIAVSKDEEAACFNTGLITDNQEPIYMTFVKNLLADHHTYWHFGSFIRQGQWQLNKFSTLPDMAHYFDDPSILVLDTRKELRANYEHIVEENADRFPDHLKSMNRFGLNNLVKGAIDSAIQRVRRNYKTAIPHYYNGAIQLLIPLCLEDPKRADLALVVERFHEFYRASTCLTIDMAYNNARQLARPDRDWLLP